MAVRERTMVMKPFYATQSVASLGSCGGGLLTKFSSEVQRTYFLFVQPKDLFNEQNYIPISPFMTLCHSYKSLI